MALTVSRMALTLLVAAAAGGVSTLAGQNAQRPAAFTAEQAEAGRVAMQKNAFGVCSDCHATGLAGRHGLANELPALGSLSADYQALINGNGGDVPALIGPSFRTRWAGRTTKNLTREFQERFAPPLSEETRLNMIAYILQANGALPGTQPLTMATDVPISTLVVPAARD